MGAFGVSESSAGGVAFAASSASLASPGTSHRNLACRAVKTVAGCAIAGYAKGCLRATSAKGPYSGTAQEFREFEADVVLNRPGSARFELSYFRIVAHSSQASVRGR